MQVHLSKKVIPGLKQIQVALFLSCLSTLSYAYTIGSNLKVENKTGISLLVTVDSYGEKKTMTISPHTSNQLDVSLWGLQLNHIFNAPFHITSNDRNNILYVQGRIAYKVDAWPSYQHSSLDSLSAAEGLTINSTYSCFTSNDTFNNTIVIEGTPGKALKPEAFPAEVHCRGFQSSTLTRDPYNDYKPTCTNGKTDTFTRDYGNPPDGIGWLTCSELPYEDDSVNFCYANNTGMYIRVNLPFKMDFGDERVKRLKGILDGEANNFCGSW